MNVPGDFGQGRTIVLFLHGVGARRKGRPWLRGLNAGLMRRGAKRLDARPEVETCAPRYGAILDGRLAVAGVRLPRRQDLAPSEAEESLYSSRRTRARARLRPLVSKRSKGQKPTMRDVPAPWLPPVVGKRARAKKRTGPLTGAFRARRYEMDRATRRLVARRVLDELGPLKKTDRVIIIGHSLGALVAWDVLTLLPRAVRVPLLLTIGSPMGTGWFPRATSAADAVPFPCERVRLWVNAYDPRDFPAAQATARGSTPRPALDARVRTGRSKNFLRPLGYAEHDEGAYLRTKLCAKVIEEALQAPDW